MERRGDEAVRVALFDSQRLDFLDPAEGLLDEPISQGHRFALLFPQTLKMHAGKAIDEDVTAAENAPGDDRDHRIDHHDQPDQKHHHHARPKKVQGGNQGAAHKLIHFAKDDPGQVRAVVLEIPRIRLTEIPPHQPCRQAVAAHVPEPGQTVGCERLHRQAQQKDAEHGQPQQDQKAVRILRAAQGIGPAKDLVGLDDRRLRHNGEERHDRGHAESLHDAHRDHHAAEQIEPAAFPFVEDFEKLAVCLEQHRLMIFLRMRPWADTRRPCATPPIRIATRMNAR